VAHVDRLVRRAQCLVDGNDTVVAQSGSATVWLRSELSGP
jgi:hypothetical protein